LLALRSPYCHISLPSATRHIATVRQGNEHVARFADANFFVREDLKQPLEAYRPELSKIIFQTKLGSMLDKSERMNKLINDLIPMLGLENDEAIFARRAVQLAKADLVTQMVMEMTSLQGIIGREYALRLRTKRWQMPSVSSTRSANKSASLSL
jgi:glycyl-tRNA synthetase